MGDEEMLWQWQWLLGLGLLAHWSWSEKHRYININCRTGSLNMLIDWEWFGCDLLNVWCKTETTFPALAGSDVWKMSFIFLRVGVELEGGCSSVGAGRPLFVRLGGLTPGSSRSQVKMFLRNKIHRNCFPNVSCFGSKHLLKWVCCKGWAHPHNKKAHPAKQFILLLFASQLQEYIWEIYVSAKNRVMWNFTFL